MKVIIVTPYFYPHTGGVENYTYNMAMHLKGLGWQVVIVTSSRRYKRTLSKSFRGLKIYYLPALFVLSNTPIGLNWRRQLRKIFIQEQPDIINAHMPVPYLADLAERMRGSIPFVLTYHNDLEKDKWPFKGGVMLLNRTLIHRTLKRSDNIIATSNYYVRRSRQLKPYTSKISVVPPGIDPKRFNTQITKTLLNNRYKGRRVILFVGSLNKTQAHKGIDILLKAFSRVHFKLPDTKLVIVGGGDGLADYKLQAENAEIGNQVEFTGSIGDKKLAQYYRLASVFTVPSTNNNEGFGMVFMEASASGTPVIGTNVGGVPYAIEAGKTGLVVKAGSVSSLYRALMVILNDPKLARQLGRAGAKRAAREFNWLNLAEQTSTIFRNGVKSTTTIVQVAGYYPPHLGGMEQVNQTLSEKLANHNYDVRVLTSSIGARSGTTTPVQGLRLSRFKAWEFAHTPFAPGFIPALFHIPSKRTIIHLHLAQAFYPELVLVVAKLRGIPYVVHFHLDLEPSGPLGPLFKIYKAVLLRAVITQANRVVVFSDEQRDFIENKYGVPRAKIAVIPNGVGKKYFLSPRAYRSGPKKLLFVGRLSSQKRLSLLLQTMALLPKENHLTIVGDGENRNELERLSNDLGLRNVRFVGRKNSDQIVEYYKRADLFIMTSKREGMPLAVLEAMAAGLPIITTKVSGLRELVDGVGVLVDRPSGQAFAQALIPLLNNPKDLERLSRQSLRAAGNYSWETLLKSFETLYTHLTS